MIYDNMYPVIKQVLFRFERYSGFTCCGIQLVASAKKSLIRFASASVLQVKCPAMPPSVFMSVFSGFHPRSVPVRLKV